jgi:hypothetical protein
LVWIFVLKDDSHQEQVLIFMPMSKIWIDLGSLVSFVDLNWFIEPQADGPIEGNH